MTIAHDSFTLERILNHSLERVFAAFADRDTKARWFREVPSSGADYQFDFRNDGRECSSFRLPEDEALPPHVRGATFTNDAIYHDIRPNERIVSSYRMLLNGQTMSVSLVTVEFEPERGGTRLRYTEQGAYYEFADGAERRKAGWVSLLDRLSTELDRGG